MKFKRAAENKKGAELELILVLKRKAKSKPHHTAMPGKEKMNALRSRQTQTKTKLRNSISSYNTTNKVKKQAPRSSTVAVMPCIDKSSPELFNGAVDNAAYGSHFHSVIY